MHDGISRCHSLHCRRGDGRVQSSETCQSEVMPKSLSLRVIGGLRTFFPQSACRHLLTSRRGEFTTLQACGFERQRKTLCDGDLTTAGGRKSDRCRPDLIKLHLLVAAVNFLFPPDFLLNCRFSCRSCFHFTFSPLSPFLLMRRLKRRPLMVYVSLR